MRIFRPLSMLVLLFAFYETVSASPAYRLAYSTFVGGTEHATAGSIAIDSLGFVYIAGRTRSKDFPIRGNPVHKEFLGWESSFIQKFDPTGKLLYSSYLNNCSVNAITVDPGSNVYAVGTYHGKDTCKGPKGYQAVEGSGTGAFVMKINLIEGRILYSARLGGLVGSTAADSVVVDEKGQAYVAGYTQSVDFPTTESAYQRRFLKTSPHVSHGFVTKLSASGNELLYSTLLQGSGVDMVDGIAVDGEGQVFAIGSTRSTDFPVTIDAYQRSNKAFPGHYNAFLTKLSVDGSSMVYSSFFGGSYTSGGSIAIDRNGDVVIAGLSYYDDNPITAGSYQVMFRGDHNNVFVAKFDASGRQLEFSTYLGAKGGNVDSAMVVDRAGKIYIAGRTANGLATTSGAFQKSYEGGLKRFSLSESLRTLTYDRAPYDAFLSVLDGSGKNLLYSTYLGGTDDDQATDLEVDKEGNVYVIGFASSSKFPLSSGASFVTRGKYGSAFLAKFSPQT